MQILINVYMHVVNSHDDSLPRSFFDSISSSRLLNSSGNYRIIDNNNDNELKDFIIKIEKIFTAIQDIRKDNQFKIEFINCFYDFESKFIKGSPPKYVNNSVF
eukprot:UN33277